MAWTVLITDNALADLREIVEFVAKDDKDAAERMGLRLLRQAEGLSTMPERHTLHDAGREIRKCPALPYLIFYRCDMDAKVVNILHFWHGARTRPAFD